MERLTKTSTGIGQAERSLNEERLHTIRHSASHVLAMAVLRLYPDAQLATGPAIDNGFYYDFHFTKPISSNEFTEIQKEMERIKTEALHFEKVEVTIEEASDVMNSLNQPYKVALLQVIKETGNTKVIDDGDITADKGEIPTTVTLYKTGDDFVDLCRGPHVSDTSKIGNFVLDSLAAAHWRSSKGNPELTRIYGLCFENPQGLKEYIDKRALAKERDHRKLGSELGLFMFDETAPGMPYWLPKGLIVLNKLVEFWREEHEERGYQEIRSPLINKQQLYVTSGHWDHYLENMFTLQTPDGEVYAVKPMNCPNAMIVYKNEARSYKDLPLRLSDTDILHRFEKSGVMNGLLRVREFSQDDAHIFVTEDQIMSEYKEILEITKLFYSIFGLDYSFRMGTRPSDFMGDIKTWEKAEKSLLEILQESGKPYSINEGDGAFYGPKIDILMKDALEREWQMGTIQLDFQLPRNFNLTYTDKDNQEKTPVAIHRVVYGSLERFIGILTEHVAGAFPLWLSPVQAVILPISDKSNEYAQQLFKKLKKEKIRVMLDNSTDTLNKKIRNAEHSKIPYMMVVGERESSENTVSVRVRGRKSKGSYPVDTFIDEIVQKNNEKSLEL